MSIRLHGDADLPPDDIRERAGDRIILHSLGEGGPIRLEDVRNINMAEHDYRGYFNIAGNQSSGNSQTQVLNLSSNLTYRKREHRLILEGKYNCGQASGEYTANNGSLNFKYDYFRSRHVYTGAFDLVETDPFQNLTVRNTGGIGLGARL